MFSSLQNILSKRDFCTLWFENKDSKAFFFSPLILHFLKMNYLHTQVVNIVGEENCHFTLTQEVKTHLFRCTVLLVFKLQRKKEEDP